MSTKRFKNTSLDDINKRIDILINNQNLSKGQEKELEDLKKQRNKLQNAHNNK